MSSRSIASLLNCSSSNVDGLFVNCLLFLFCGMSGIPNRLKIGVTYAGYFRVRKTETVKNIHLVGNAGVFSFCRYTEIRKHQAVRVEFLWFDYLLGFRGLIFSFCS